MTPEAHVFTALQALVGGRCYPDVAPSTAVLPRIVYQQVGGRSVTYTEGTVPDRENARMQIACWATTREAATTLARQAEAALMAASLQCEPLGARVSGHEPDTGLYGARQDFSLWVPL